MHSTARPVVSTGLAIPAWNSFAGVRITEGSADQLSCRDAPAGESLQDDGRRDSIPPKALWADNHGHIDINRSSNNHIIEFHHIRLIAPAPTRHTYSSLAGYSGVFDNQIIVYEYFDVGIEQFHFDVVENSILTGVWGGIQNLVVQTQKHIVVGKILSTITNQINIITFAWVTTEGERFIGSQDPGDINLIYERRRSFGKAGRSGYEPVFILGRVLYRGDPVSLNNQKSQKSA